MKSLDDLPDVVTRAESATGIMLKSIQRDLDTCGETLECVSFDTDTQRAMLDKVCEIATAAANLRCDMECHLLATAQEWLDKE